MCKLRLACPGILTHHPATFVLLIAVIQFPSDSTADPRWRSPADPRLAGLRGRRPWLLDEGSLTRRLVDSGQRFRVQRLHQGWGTPRHSEQRTLGCPRRGAALIREVALLLDEVPVVFARSVFPYRSLCGSLAHLRRLEASSLGAILFSDPSMRRSPFRVACLAPHSAYLPPALRQPEPAWARRSVFSVAGQRLLVSEVFLAAFRPAAERPALQRGYRGRVSAAIPAAKQ
jgi:chorismate--pyruvate lyase